jgi:hypothetical protein
MIKLRLHYKMMGTVMTLMMIMIKADSIGNQRMLEDSVYPTIDTSTMILSICQGKINASYKILSTRILVC